MFAVSTSGVVCSFCRKVPALVTAQSGNHHACYDCVAGMVGTVAAQRAAYSLYFLRVPEVDTQPFTMMITDETLAGAIFAWCLVAVRRFPSIPKQAGSILNDQFCPFCSQSGQMVVTRLGANICLICLQAVAEAVSANPVGPPRYTVRSQMIDQRPIGDLGLPVDRIVTIGDALDAYNALRSRSD